MLLIFLLIICFSTLTVSTPVLNFQVRGLAADNSISIQEVISGEIHPLITEDGAYSFSDAVPRKKKFKLVLLDHPSSPIEQQCDISKAAGKISSKGSNNIVVTCRTLIKHVVIIGLDGVGGAYLPLEGRDNINVRLPSMPTIESILTESAWTFVAQDALPPTSSTNWASMVGGNPPDVHGVLSNSWERGDSVIPPTLFALTREKHPSSDIGIFYDWDGFGRLVEDDAATIKSSPGSAENTRDAMIDFLIEYHPLLTFVHLDSCDAAGHSYGWGGEQYVNSLVATDGIISSIVNVLKEEGMWDYTALLISSDHGGEGTYHAYDTYLERTIPVIVRTPQGTDKMITKEVRIWDVAATAAALLDINHPDYWISSPLYEAIPFSSESEAMISEKNFYRQSESATVVFSSEGTDLSDLTILRPDAPEGYLSLGDIALSYMSDGSTCELDDQTCSCKPSQDDYRGTIATTTSGRTCQKWTKQSPHEHTRTPENYPDAGLGDHNYCRNPDGEDSAWCYTTDESTRWEPCEVPTCPRGPLTAYIVRAEHPSIKHPQGYEMIWNMKGSSEEKKLSLWNPIPLGGYGCPGVVAKTDYDGPPPLNAIACVHDTFLDDSILSPSFVWDDRGSGADKDGSIWNCEGDVTSNNIIDPHLFLSRRGLESYGPGNNDCRMLKKTKFRLCEDDPNFTFKNKPGNDCSWVATKTRVCKKKSKGQRVSDFCPKSCNECS